MLRAIQEIKPKYVIAENVFGITNIDGGMVFEQVCLDLEAEGYEVQPFILPAAAKNSPHRRDRVWFIAQNTLLSRRLHREFEQEGTEIWEQRNTCSRSADGIYLQKRNATNTDCNGFDQCNCNNEKYTGERRINAFGDIKQSNVNGNAANSTSTRGRKDNRIRESRFNDQNSKRNDWQNFPTQSPICGGDDGLPTELDGITFPKWRAESIKGYGNAIVPQVAFELFKIICNIEK